MVDALYSSELICSYVDFKNSTDKHKFIFSFRGKMSHAVVKNLLSMAEKKMDVLQEAETVKKKIFGVMINCLQTICSEAKTIEDGDDSIFLISKDEGGFTVFAGRNLSESIASKLAGLINEVNQLDRNSLLDLHKEKLKELQNIGEAFNIDETILGLVDIAKRSGKNINYLIENIESDKVFFSIKVLIN
ncbi:MAG: SiaB family protein kinase [Bacteroidota bacterium]|nr:SiaB family protein kinase [Bacteroidota bacterium]